jgi:glycosyltransferase involved in cell wall biosynthesis
MKILFIAPIPPPVTGHSLASEVLREGLTHYHDVAVVNLSKQHGANAAARRVTEVLGILKDTWKKKKNADVLYLTISESFGGNVKDLLIYTICRKSLGKLYIHLHGGSIRRLLFDHHPVLRYLNRQFIRRMAGVVISGKSHLPIFEGMVSAHRLHIVPNFAPNDLFVPVSEIEQKFSGREPLRVLYISGLEQKKGYRELTDAYLSLDERVKARMRLDIVGRFDDPEASKHGFLNKIASDPRIRYHGVVDNEQKLEFFRQAHVFCLPTAHFEGQPISILEAYASGCVVLATTPPGILDIFTPGVNGLGIADASASSIKLALHEILDRPDLLQIAVNNRSTAGEQYRATTFNSRMREVIETGTAPIQAAVQRMALGTPAR